MNDSAAIPSPDGDRRAVVMSGAAEPGPVAVGPAEPGPVAAGPAEPGFATGLEFATVGLLTARLRLRPVVDGDLEELFALHADPRAFVEDSTLPLSDRAQMRWVLERWIEGWERHGRGYLSVRARDSVRARHASAAGREHGASAADSPVPDSAPQTSPSPALPSPALPSGLLGVVGLSVLESDRQPLLSAYWRLDPAVTGRGVASEAMSAVLTDPHCGPRGQEVVAVTAARNRPSRSLAARLGFQPAPAQRPVPGGREGDVLLVRPAS